MKKLCLLLSGLFICTAALAADNDDAAIPQENLYASRLCQIVHDESQAASADVYLQKLKSAMAAGNAADAPQFNEDIASEVVSAWLQLGEEERRQLRASEPQCEQTVMTQFQQED